MSAGATTVLLGTTKGAFFLERVHAEATWTVAGPFCDGWTINHMTSDPKTGRIWAAGGGAWEGAGVWRSDDHGAHWQVARLTDGQRDTWAANDPDFAEMIGWTDTPKPFGSAFEQIWSLHHAHGALFAGTKPARLLRSKDDGQTWAEVESLANHPSADSWNAGAAGLTLHTIVTHPRDPDRMWIGISAAGVFATEDGGASWTRRNRLSNATACAGQDHPAAPAHGEIGHCVHNMVRAPGTEDVLYQQNHHGVWRSDSGGRSWDDITLGLPSTFGFPILVHPQDPNCIWTIPLNGDSAGRYPPNAAAAVWRSIDCGANWEACRNGLPQEACFFTVLRQAMAHDEANPLGIYFGTNSGSVFASFDMGCTWSEIARHLPTILSVETLSRA
ncbi:WD40/YVTN/BNR-like repeat-containing protein [Tropicimonas sp. S265A]|uniref:WD40/YVTN/BNR-like repeat-containing protein n=1 Tax=Tropicimonas sp. S265A TaxID=3415134 RepID=UPI003C7C148F